MSVMCHFLKDESLCFQNEVLNEDWSVKEGCGFHGT